MAGDEAKQKKARTRSPAYPYLGLPEALERTAQLRRAEGRHAVSVAVAMQHWGYKAESSTGYSCIAALKKFGLVDEEGIGEHREVRLSALALTLLLDADGENTPGRAEALRTAALNPRIHAELWERYGPELPSDQTLRRFLLLEKNFNEASVDEFIAEYRATIAFAKLSEPIDPGAPGPAFTALPASSPLGRPPKRRPATVLPDEPPPLPGLLGTGELVPTERERPAAAGAAREDHAAPASSLPEPEIAVVPAPHSGTARQPSAAPEGGMRELPVPLDQDLVVRVPYPMSEESFDLLIDTLKLWKKRLVRPAT